MTHGNFLPERKKRRIHHIYHDRKEGLQLLICLLIIARYDNSTFPVQRLLVSKHLMRPDADTDTDQVNMQPSAL